MFAEGTRVRPGALGRPKRGVGRLALETGVPVVPVAIIGTENVRKGILIRPHKVRVRVGSPLTFPRVEHASPQVAAAVTDRIWPNVMLQWEWLGGLPPLRRAAVIGDGPWAAAVASMLGRAGLEVDRGPGLELSRHDLVCFATPASALPRRRGPPRRADPGPRGRARRRARAGAAARHAPRRLRGRADARMGDRRAGRADRSRRREPVRGRRGRPRLPPSGRGRPVRRALRRHRQRRRDRRRARRLRDRRGRARRRGGGPAARRRRRRQGLRRGRALRADRRRRARHLRRAGRHRRPGRDRPRPDLRRRLRAPDPAARRAVRAAGVDAPVLAGLAGVVCGRVSSERWIASLAGPHPAVAPRAHAQVA